MSDRNYKHWNTGNKGVASGNWNGSLHEDQFGFLKWETLRQTIRATMGVKYLVVVKRNYNKQLRK